MKVLKWCCCITFCVLVGCTSDQSAEAPQRESRIDRTLPVVMTTIEANRYLAERVGGSALDVRYPVPSDADPLAWEPNRAEIAVLQQADLVLLNGAGLEPWSEHVSLVPSRTEVLADRYRDQWLEFEGVIEHQHGPEGGHSHHGTDPHVWMDPQLARSHVEQMVEIFSQRFPEGASGFQERGGEVLADLDALDEQYRTMFADLKPTFYANHPAYDYLGRRYGWSLINLDLDPETAPDPSSIPRNRDDSARYILWESDPIPAAVAALQAIGLTSVTISPAEHSPETGDWLTAMQENARQFEKLRE